MTRNMNFKAMNKNMFGSCTIINSNNFFCLFLELFPYLGNRVKTEKSFKYQNPGKIDPWIDLASWSNPFPVTAFLSIKR